MLYVVSLIRVRDGIFFTDCYKDAMLNVSSLWNTPSVCYWTLDAYELLSLLVHADSTTWQDRKVCGVPSANITIL